MPAQTLRICICIILRMSTNDAWGITMFLNELKKTFGKKTLLVLLCVMLLNGVLIVFGESDKGYNFTGEDYRKLYSAEDMHGDTETQLAYLNARLEENGMSRQYFLLRYVISDVEKVADYKGYLQSIADSAEKYSRLSIFMDGDEFSKRNVEKTAAVYASLPEIIPIPGKSRGVVMASWYNPQHKRLVCSRRNLETSVVRALR